MVQHSAEPAKFNGKVNSGGLRQRNVNGSPDKVVTTDEGKKVDQLLDNHYG